VALSEHWKPITHLHKSLTEEAFQVVQVIAVHIKISIIVFGGSKCPPFASRQDYSACLFSKLCFCISQNNSKNRVFRYKTERGRLCITKFISTMWEWLLRAVWRLRVLRETWQQRSPVFHTDAHLHNTITSFIIGSSHHQHTDSLHWAIACDTWLQADLLSRNY